MTTARYRVRFEVEGLAEPEVELSPEFGDDPESVAEEAAESQLSNDPDHWGDMEELPAIVEELGSQGQVVRAHRVSLGIRSSVVFQAIEATLLVLALAFLAAPASAQGLSARLRRLPCPEVEEGLLLARLAVHEASGRALEDVGPIWQAIDTVARRRGTSWREAACWHSARFTRGAVRRTWTTQLQPDGSEPRAWPRAEASWTEFRGFWLSVLARARTIAAEGGRFCSRPPETWGSSSDIAARERAAAERGRARPIVVIRCQGTTANRFVVWGSR